MKKSLASAVLIFFTATMAFFSMPIKAQTLSLNDGTIVQQKTNRIGLNIGSINFYDNGQILKNLIGSNNPGFEPLVDRQVWTLISTGTTTTFTDPDIYDGVSPDYWAGGTFTVVGGPELGCTGTVVSNTGPNYPANTTTIPAVFTVTACPSAFSVGDIVILSKTTSPTPESWWENSRGGTWGGVSGGGKLLSDTTDLCATCGKQALNMNATASGSSATANWYFDSAYTLDIFVLMNGTYELSFWAKASSGTPTLTASARRLSQGGFNCNTSGSYTPALSPTWTQYTFTCTAAETAGGTTPGTAQVSIQVTGGSVYLDNVSFAKTSSSINNSTVLRDEVIEALQNYYGNAAGGPPGIFRYWVNQNGETLDNWTQPDYAHGPTTSGGGYFTGPGGSGAMNLSLEDYLVICQMLDADPYLEVPVTFSTTEAGNLIEFLAGSSGSTYGARRAALGQVSPWTSVFDKIHLSFCNECWNGFSFVGQSLPSRTSVTTEYYYDYSVRAKDIFAAMRANSSYSPTSFDLVMNAQTAVNWSMDTAIQRAHPDSIEIEDYTYSTVNDYSSDAALWGPAMVEPYEKVINPTDPKNFYQSVHDYQSQTSCGATGTAQCNVNIYEWGEGTLQGSIDQTHMDYITAGAGQGVVMALQPLLNLQYYGILPQSYFSLTEYLNGAINGDTAKIWGNVVDMGGATGNVRPEFLALSLVNQSIIGPMYSCPINNSLTYNFAGSGSNGNSTTPALSNVPYLYAFCFENGTQRSMVLINTDLVNKHALSFAGNNPPAGSVTVRQYAPPSLDAMNEAPTGTATNQTPATVSLTTNSLSSPSSITLPPYSVTALDYTATGAPAATAATPTFSVASGTYTSTQTVKLSDATAGATVYYTTNGTTPTTSSTKYTGSITVSTSETVKAIAVASGYTNSPVASATYTITISSALPAPIFSPAGGSYSSPQSVTIGDATSGTTIYYTTNGATPTTSSTKYKGTITVSTAETLKAIAVKSGYTNSPIASASYTFTQVPNSPPPALTAPTFSPAGGNYSSPQSVTISDATSGAAIYYTTDGTTPTTSSTKFTSPIAVSSSETIEAIAVASGYTNSSIAEAAYSITSPSSGYINYPTGGFTSSALYLNYGATVTGGALQLTDGNGGENRSAWFSTPVSVQSFVTDFTFQQLNATADGMTFTIQGQGGGSLGYPGSGLGYQGIPQSVAIKFDLYDNAGEGNDSTGIYINGVSPTVPAIDLSSTGINLHSGDVMQAHLVYNGTNLTMTLTDTVTKATVTEIFPVNIPNIVGGNTAYVGFTGGTGGAGATQNVLSWTYSTQTTYVNYLSGGFTSSAIYFNYGASITGGALQLTDGNGGENRSAWLSTPVPVQSFVTDFTFQQLNATADGMTFTIQGQGGGSLGYPGSGLGYQGIPQSVAIKFDLYDNAGEGNDSTGIYINGVSPTVPAIDLSSTGINLHSGDVMQAHLVYNGTNLTMTLTDTVTKATVTEVFPVNIPSIVGGNTAYIGFTGGTGGAGATQNVLSWTYSAP